MPPSKKRPSIYDVAKMASVSPATVSKVLHGVTTVKKANVERINNAIEVLGYRPDPMASDMRREKRRIIGVVVPELAGEFFSNLVANLERYVEKRGYTMVAMSSNECESREQHLIERLEDWRVAGIVLAPVTSEQGMGSVMLEKSDIDAVLIDRVTENKTFDTVSVDDVSASKQVAQKLCEDGHRHIAVVGINRDRATTKRRVEGFLSVTRNWDEKVTVDLILPEDIGELKQTLSEYLDDKKPSAMYSLFAKSTLMTLTEFRRKHIHCPDDIGLIGFDDAEWMQVTYPSVSAVIQPVELIAKRAIGALFNRIEGLNASATAVMEHCDVVFRESTKKVEQ